MLYFSFHSILILSATSIIPVVSSNIPASIVIEIIVSNGSTSIIIPIANVINDDININNSISIVADPYAYENFHNMRYAILEGVKWKITNVEINRPRLILTIGGVYNG